MARCRWAADTRSAGIRSYMDLPISPGMCLYKHLCLVWYCEGETYTHVIHRWCGDNLYSCSDSLCNKTNT